VPQPIELPAQPSAAEEPAPVAEPIPAIIIAAPHAAELDAGAPALPVSWSVTFGHTRTFVEAIRIARTARASFDVIAATSVVTDAGTPTPKQFERASSLLDQGSRQFAAAYHAPDASSANKIDALREAADMILAWSRRIDEAGLARAPATYRSDSAVALTFEDVANGPAKRWREEGLALVHLCIESARASGISSPSARDCSTMRQSYARVIGKKPLAMADAGASGCACDPGDPLCSASMSGWCRPK
jgi:hypothetical protein